MRVTVIAATLFWLVCAVAWAQPVAGTSVVQAAPSSPRSVVVAFYEQALQAFEVRQAFARYMAPDFIEHSSDAPGGTTEGIVTFLEGLIRKSPKPRWEIVRTIAEGDLVFLHARFTPAPDAPPVAVAEIFRVRNGKIIEHWDVIAPTPEQPVNPRSMF